MSKNVHILRLREYESAKIGSQWDACHKTVPAHVASELERFQAERRTEFLDISRKRITAQNFVGVVGVGQCALEILPKTDETDDAARRRLIEMMSFSGLLPHLEAGTADLAASVPCLLDAFMQAYIRQLALEWHRGRIANYRKTDENRAFLRGKLVFHVQIRRNLLRPERFFTRADEFLTDVLPSRLLKAGLDVCRRYGLADDTRRNAATLLAEFGEVSLQRFSSGELDSVVADRRISRFDPLLVLARQFLRGCVPDRPGNAKTYSLLFDMNEVFERYIGALIRRACPSALGVQLQASGHSLALRNGKPAFRLRPDVAIRRKCDAVLIVDTKWKLLDSAKPHAGVRQSDMYQAYAYVREFNCPRALFLFPRFGDLKESVASYRLRPGSEECSRIEVGTIDVRMKPSQIIGELKTRLSDLCRS